MSGKLIAEWSVDKLHYRTGCQMAVVCGRTIGRESLRVLLLG